MKKMNTQIQTPTKQRYTTSSNSTKPKEQLERRNPASNHWEFHGDVTRHGQPKRTTGTQELRRKQK
jgi:hypothetical protein